MITRNSLVLTIKCSATSACGFRTSAADHRLGPGRCPEVVTNPIDLSGAAFSIALRCSAAHDHRRVRYDLVKNRSDVLNCQFHVPSDQAEARQTRYDVAHRTAARSRSDEEG